MKPLRTVLKLNATSSALSGAGAVLAAGPVAELLGVSATGYVRLVGAALIVFAADVAWTARSPVPSLRRGALVVSLADLAWVGATTVTIGLGWYSTQGAVMMAGAGLGVGALGVLQLLLRQEPPGRLASAEDDLGQLAQVVD